MCLYALIMHGYALIECYADNACVDACVLIHVIDACV